MKKYAMVILVLMASLLVLPACSIGDAAGREEQPRAAIIDQLYLLEPKAEFIQETVATLEASGFTVDVWQGEAITVDFYRKLPQAGYKLIVFRVHSGLLLSLEDGRMVPSQTTYLFTGETYSTGKYVPEQLQDRVSNALMTDKYPLVFAVNSEFIRKNMSGDFEDTAIVMMGCESYYYSDMAAAFLEKGASVYLGWDKLVSLDYVDEVTGALLRNLCTGELEVEKSVHETMKKYGLDPYFKASLKFAPDKAGNRTINELLR